MCLFALFCYRVWIEVAEDKGFFMSKSVFLNKLDQEGWILAPGETEDALLARKALVEEMKAKEFAEDDTNQEGAWAITQELFEFCLKEVPIVYGKKSLLPWQGAALWSYSVKKGENFPVLQIRNTSLYNQKEMLAHEMVHAARFAFKEPLFEEIFAYKTSKNRLRRFLGPLCIFSFESFLLVSSPWLGFLGNIFFNKEIFFWLPLFFLALLFIRLFILQSLLQIAEKRLRSRGEKNPLAKLFRMSDRGIIRLVFSKDHENIEK